MEFAFEALRSDGTTVTDQVDAPGRDDAAETLRQRGLIVLRLEEAGGQRGGALRWQSTRVTTRDHILFTRQMKMLLESGAPVVPALEAAQQQTNKPVMRALIRRLHDAVEEGATLSGALDDEAEHFDTVFRSMVAAGEATATLPTVFGRLCELAQLQEQTRSRVRGALIYPAVLMVLLSAVCVILLIFVVPRFEILFNNLGSPLPATTKILFAASVGFRAGWPYLLGGAIPLGIALYLLLQTRSAHVWIDNVVMRIPLIGRLAARLVLARVLRIWAAMLRCHVPLLEAIQQSREAITNAAFLRLLADVEDSVASGSRMGQAMQNARLADPIIVSAIRTGEENGRLAEATEFVSSWLDEDNATTIHGLTRMAEPVLLAVMGLIVGFVALALFVPLFDIATAAG